MFFVSTSHITGPTWQHGEEGTAEAVAHGVGAQADVHAGVVLLGPGDEQLVEVGAVGPRPHFAGGQHHEAVVAHLDGGVVTALLVALHALQPLDDRQDVAPHLALEGRGAAVAHRRVDGVRARQHGFGVCPLCAGKGEKKCSSQSCSLQLEFDREREEYHM